MALYTDLLVREDLMQLFGFRTLAEREWHRLLMTVQGVGAKAALAILGALGTEGVARALSLGDAAAIRAAPGIGPKIAQRVILELKAKAPAVIAMGAHGAAPVDGSATASRRGAVGGACAAGAPAGDAQAQADALSALVNLGYGAGEAAAAIAGVEAEDAAGLIRGGAARAGAEGIGRWPVPIPRCRPEPLPEDADRALRPQTLDEFVGQKAARANLAVFIESARRRGEAMDHTLFYGPPGLGKTTLAQIMARELGVNFRMTSGPVLAKAGDLAAILTNLDARDVLFIDEIHRLSPVVEEILYPALEDFQLDLVIGEGPAARTVRLELQPFTLVGATTRLGLLTTPLRDRFGIPTRLEFYDVDELVQIVTRAARLMKADATPDGAREIARRARGTPRIAGRLLRRVADFAIVEGDGQGDARDRRPGADAARGRRPRARRGGPALPAAAGRELRRRAGRGRDDRGGALGGARRDRGGDRALPAAAGADPAHPARADAGGEGLDAPRPGAAAGGRRRSATSSRTADGRRSAEDRRRGRGALLAARGARLLRRDAPASAFAGCGLEGTQNDQDRALR